MSTTARKPRTADHKSVWKSKNDRGPHTAVFPSGVELTFILPDETALIRADKLPDRLMEIALFSAAYPDGVEGYMADVAVRAVNSPDDAEANARLKKSVKDGLEMRDWLVAEMLVDPEVTPEEVAAGEFPKADIEMLLEFAERRRNTDAAGNRLPIVVLEEYARFRDLPGGGTGGELGEGDEPAVQGAGVGADGGEM